MQEFCIYLEMNVVWGFVSYLNKTKQNHFSYLHYMHIDRENECTFLT